MTDRGTEPGASGGMPGRPEVPGSRFKGNDDRIVMTLSAEEVIVPDCMRY
jgi:hypothetical protein